MKHVFPGLKLGHLYMVYGESVIENIQLSKVSLPKSLCEMLPNRLELCLGEILAVLVGNCSIYLLL